MPARPAKACAIYGCPHTQPCPTHSRAARGVYKGVRGRSPVGYGRRWNEFAQRFMGQLWTLQVPRAGLCGCRHPSAPATEDSVCARDGVIRMATVVDHIVPVRGRDDPDLYRVDNLQALCGHCHDAKRQRESLRARR